MDVIEAGGSQGAKLVRQASDVSQSDDKVCPQNYAEVCCP